MIMNYNYSKVSIIKIYLIIFFVGWICGVVFMVLKKDPKVIPTLLSEKIHLSENKKNKKINLVKSKIKNAGKDLYILESKIKIEDVGVITYKRKIKLYSDFNNLFLNIGINNIFLDKYDFMPTIGVSYVYKMMLISCTFGYSFLSNNIAIGGSLGIKIW